MFRHVTLSLDARVEMGSMEGFLLQELLHSQAGKQQMQDGHQTSGGLLGPPGWLACTRRGRFEQGGALPPQLCLSSNSVFLFVSCSPFKAFLGMVAVTEGEEHFHKFSRTP